MKHGLTNLTLIGAIDELQMGLDTAATANMSTSAKDAGAAASINAETSGR